MIEYVIFDRDEMDLETGEKFKNVRSKVVLNLYNETLRDLKDGEVYVTDGWIHDKNYGGEYRIILQGRRTGAGKEQNLILDPFGRPLVRIPV